MTSTRNWHCRNCGRSNTTEIQLDGKVKCEFCKWVMRIQPSRVRGGETAGQMARTLPRAYRSEKTGMAESAKAITPGVAERA
jgi:DNA-directed RNA polymerase subunit RPC12/RpoP